MLFSFFRQSMASFHCLIIHIHMHSYAYMCACMCMCAYLCQIRPLDPSPQEGTLKVMYFKFYVSNSIFQTRSSDKYSHLCDNVQSGV